MFNLFRTYFTALDAPPLPRINAFSGFLFSIKPISDFSKPIKSVLNPMYLLLIFFIIDYKI